MTKAEWLEEGKALGARDSINGWEIGRWIIRGEEQFFSVPSSKKAQRAFWKTCRADWRAFIREAEEVTNLKENTLRQYARIVRHGLRVDGLPLAHHLEVLRAHRTDEKDKRQFDFSGARDILNLALKNKWSARATRAEAVRRYPSLKAVETPLEKARKAVVKVLKTIDGDARLEFLEALVAELSRIQDLEADAMWERNFPSSNTNTDANDDVPAF